MGSKSGQSPSLPDRQIVFWRDPLLPMIEGRKATGSYRCYRAHTHATLSIGIVDEGRSTFSLGQQVIPLRAGAVVVVAPGQVHSCNPRRDRPWSYRMFHFDAGWSRTIAADLLASAAWPQGVVTAAAAPGYVRRIERALVDRSGNVSERRAEIASGLRRLLRLCATGERSTPAETAPAISATRDYLDSHHTELAPVAQLARMAGMSSFRLIRGFKRAYGLTPHAYQLDRRVNHTRELLRQGHALADVAYMTGFADQSHFQRVFKTRVAATPAEYSSSTSAQQDAQGCS